MSTQQQKNKHSFQLHTEHSLGLIVLSATKQTLTNLKRFKIIPSNFYNHNEYETKNQQEESWKSYKRGN